MGVGREEWREEWIRIWGWWVGMKKVVLSNLGGFGIVELVTGFRV